MPDMTIAHPRDDIVVKPLAGVDPARTVHAAWVRDRRTPGVEPNVDARVASAPERQG